MDSDQQLNLFQTRLRQMILQYKATLEENKTLSDKVGQQQALISQLEEQLSLVRKELDNLMTAKMLAATAGDIEKARRQVQMVIRDMNRCITLLGEN